jgi:apolipoprotein D and lipocalin family protein
MNNKKNYKKILLISLSIFLFVFIAREIQQYFTRSHNLDNKIHIKQVDLQKYSGVWYQILEAKGNQDSLFSFVESPGEVCHNVKVEYTVDGKNAKLKNVCNDGGPEGREISITGTARPVDETNTKFKVTFDPWYLKLFSFDYWIVDVDENYQTAILSSPKGNGFTILSRSKFPDNTVLENAKQKAINLGYSLENSVVTPQK